MSFINQGEAFIKKKIKKIDQMFASNQEGFSGILGPNAELDLVNQTEYLKINTSVNKLNSNINTYQTATTALQNKTNEYLNNTKDLTAGDEKRNYNVFINKSLGVKALIPEVTKTTKTTTSTVNKINKVEGTALCVPESALADFVDGSNNGFDKAYPKNFSGFPAALEACQTWAADLGFKYFGVSKNGSKYKCYTSEKSPASVATNFTMPVPVYTVAATTDTTRGGLFSNGQVGVYRSIKDAKWNIDNMNPIVHFKHYNTAKYPDSEPKPYKLAIEYNFWGWSKQEFSVDPQTGWSSGINKFPNDKTAWWIGIMESNPDPTLGINTNIRTGDELYKAKTGDKDTCYFYYVYDAPETGQDIGIYAVAVSQGLKINGVSIRFTKDNGPKSLWGYESSHRLAPGKNVFEIARVFGLPQSAFVVYVYDIETNNILFRSGDPGWGVTAKPTPDWNLVTKIPFTAQYIADPYLFAAANKEPNGFYSCDKLLGGNINMKTINATYGKNCSTATKPPLKVRYIKFTPNGMLQPIQISQLVVMAYMNGILKNVANIGSISSSPSPSNADNHIPVNGKTDNSMYWSSGPGKSAFWRLDLGAEFPIASITFYNRPDFNSYADGMVITLSNGDRTPYTLKSPTILTSQLMQTFTLSIKDVVYKSPTYINAPPGYTVPLDKRTGLWWYGFNGLAAGKEMCESRGQRVCRIEEVQNYDWQEAGVDFAVYPDNTIGLPNKSRLSGRGIDGARALEQWISFGQNPPGNLTGIVCCDVDHVGAYDPVKNPMTAINIYNP